MDSLKQAAIAFQNLFDTEYNIILGKKGKLYQFCIEFRKQDFFHLAGLHYLKDLPQIKKNGEIIFDKILRDELTEEKIKKSSFYHKIQDRISGLADIEKIMDSNETVFRFFKKKSSFSDIEAEYFLQTIYENRTNYIFIDRIDENQKFCKSFFFNDTNDYRENQVRMTLLKKEKINKTENKTLLLCDKLG